MNNTEIAMFMNPKEHNTSILSESGMDFLIDNYSEILSSFRKIVKTEKEVKQKYSENIKIIRKYGERELKKIVKRKTRLEASGDIYNEDELKAFNEEKEYLLELINHDLFEDVKHKGKIVKYSPVVEFILKNRKIIQRLEIFDLSMRNKLGWISEKAIKLFLIPVSKCVEWTDNDNIRNILTDYNYAKIVGDFFRNPI